MPQDVRVTKGTGPDQLPQGEAASLNRLDAPAVEAVKSQDNPLAPTAPSPLPAQTPLQLQQPNPGFNQPVGGSEDDQLLYGPTTRPNEAITAGMTSSGRTPPPADIGSWLPALIEASKDPEAPPQLHQLLALITYHLGQ